MQPPSVINPTNNKVYLTQEHRSRLYQILSDLDDEQLRLFLKNHVKTSSSNNQFQHYARLQLFQQCLILIDNYYTNELEQTLYALRQQKITTDLYQQSQTNLSLPFNQHGYRFNPSNYRFPPPPPSAITQQLRPIRPNTNSSQLSNGHNSRPHLSQQSPYVSPILSHQQQIHHLSSSKSNPISNTSSTSAIQHYQTSVFPTSAQTPTSFPSPSSSSSSSSSHPTLILPSTNNSQRSTINKIIHKNLPFYHVITCVHERYYIFHYDQYRKQYMSHDEFLLSFDICNQLALSYDYDPDSNTHKTSKCLLLRLARIDQPPTFNGKYDDNLPPNLVINVNGHTLTNLPIPKACTRQQNDLIRIGREIDITPNCMFNPILKNEIKIAWSYRQDNTNLQIQYANAQYALHIYLVERLTIEDLCENIKNKSVKFFHEDLVKLLAKARANDRDLGLEVSDQKLKLTCPIDQRRLKIPVRATTCQHLQCFDLINYIALNEKSNKWICPVCNKYALYEDLQIDSYTESILKSIQNENITEITINGDLFWKPVIQSKINNDEPILSITKSTLTSSNDIIFIDDD